MVIRPIWYGDQHWGHGFPVAPLCFCFLPPVDICDTRDNELERGDVCWRHRIGDYLLLGQGPASFRSARGINTERGHLALGLGSLDTLSYRSVILQCLFIFPVVWFGYLYLFY